METNIELAVPHNFSTSCHHTGLAMIGNTTPLYKRDFGPIELEVYVKTLEEIGNYK
jgi:hypothetical protein